jgi:flavorubredoxin
VGDVPYYIVIRPTGKDVEAVLPRLLETIDKIKSICKLVGASVIFLMENKHADSETKRGDNLRTGQLQKTGFIAGD